MSARKQSTLVQLRQAMRNGQTPTAQDLGTSAIQMQRYEAQGDVRRRGVIHTGDRGRPAVKWSLTDKGRRKADRMLAKVA